MELKHITLVYFLNILLLQPVDGHGLAVVVAVKKVKKLYFPNIHWIKISPMIVF